MESALRGLSYFQTCRQNDSNGHTEMSCSITTPAGPFRSSGIPPAANPLGMKLSPHTWGAAEAGRGCRSPRCQPGLDTDSARSGVGSSTPRGEPMTTSMDAGRTKTVIGALFMAVALGIAPGCAAADHPMAETNESRHVAGEVDGSTSGRIAVVPLDSSLRRFHPYPD